MRDRDRTSLGYLLLEPGYDGAAGAEHVAEAGGDEPRPAPDLPSLDGQPEGLYVYLGEPLGASHDVGGVYGLVRGDHDHPPDVVAYACVRDVARARDVGVYGLARVLLHQRHVLVCGGMEDDLRPVCPEGEVEPPREPDVPYDGREVQPREPLGELEPEVVDGRLGVVVEHEPPHSERGELPAQLAPYRSRGPGDQHCPAPEHLPDLSGGYPYLLPPDMLIFLTGDAMTLPSMTSSICGAMRHLTLLSTQ